MRAITVGEVVDVQSTLTLVPLRFSWRGKQYRVAAVERSQATRSTEGLTTNDRQVVRVRTAYGLRCVLVFDRRRSTWLIEKVLSGKVD